jgi:DNA-directed RNA polymerase sigma subunit (sigma70/sigma32)
VSVDERRRKPRLTADEEKKLWCQAQAGDESAEAKLIENHMGLVKRIARTAFDNALRPGVRNRVIFLDDLINEGTLGLLKAVRAWRPFDAGAARLVTLAFSYITKEISALAGTTDEVGQIPEYLVKHVAQLHRASRSAGLLSLSDAAQVLSDNGIPAPKQEKVLAYFFRTMSSAEHTGIQELVSESLDERGAGHTVGLLLDCLDPTERELVTRTYGLIGSPESLTVAAARVGLPRPEAKAVLDRAIVKMKTRSQAGDLDQP